MGKKTIFYSSNEKQFHDLKKKGGFNDVGRFYII